MLICRKERGDLFVCAIVRNAYGNAQLGLEIRHIGKVPSVKSMMSLPALSSLIAALLAALDLPDTYVYARRCLNWAC
jgi:hypothetical protein